MKPRRLLLALAALAASLASCRVDSTPPAHQNLVEDWRDEVIYQVIVDRFANGDPNNDQGVRPGDLGQYQGGDWQGIIDHLDYIVELGVTALWISPVVRNVESDAGFAGYHGYWTQDFGGTNPHFGDLAKLRELVERCHDRDVKVILDVVTNHVGQLFYYDINRNGVPDDSTYGSGWEGFDYDGDGDVDDADRAQDPVWVVSEYDPPYDPDGVQAFTSLGGSGPAPMTWIYMPEVNRVPPLPEEFQDLDWYHGRGRVTDWGDSIPVEQNDQLTTGDFPGGLKDLKTELPEVREALVRVFGQWITDVDFDGFRIDTLKHVEHGFWQTFCPAIREHAVSEGKENFLMFGEAFDGRDEELAAFTREGELDSVFYFSQKFQVFDDVLKWGAGTRKIEELWTARFERYGATPQPGGIGVPPSRALVNFIDNHDIPRFLYDRPDVPALHSALFLLLTEDGIPCIYYGTEQGFSGGNDPANREVLWETGFDTTGETFALIRDMNLLRRSLAPLRRGDLAVRWSSDRTGEEQDAGIFAFERTYEGETALVVLNVHDTRTSSTSATEMGGGDMATAFPGGTRLVDVSPMGSGETFTVAADGSLSVPVGPRQGRVLVTEGVAEALHVP